MRLVTWAGNGSASLFVGGFGRGAGRGQGRGRGRQSGGGGGGDRGVLGGAAGCGGRAPRQSPAPVGVVPA